MRRKTLAIDRVYSMKDIASALSDVDHQAYVGYFAGHRQGLFKKRAIRNEAKSVQRDYVWALLEANYFNANQVSL